MPSPETKKTATTSDAYRGTRKQLDIATPTLEQFVEISRSLRESKAFAHLGLDRLRFGSYLSNLSIDENAVPVVGYEDNLFVKFEIDFDRVAAFLASNNYENTRKAEGPHQFSTWRVPGNAHGIILKLPAIVNEGLYAYPCKIGRKNQLILSTSDIHCPHSPGNKPILLRAFETKAEICIQTNPPSSYDEAAFVAKADKMLALHEVVVPEHKLFTFDKGQYGARWLVGDEIDKLLLAIAKTDWPLIAHNKNFGELSAMSNVELSGPVRK